MNCRTCSYTLWNLVARQCPECGTAFKPSEFEFTPGSVRYLCPHCSQTYYGTAETGHLVPRSFTCVRCSRQIDMDEMTLLPAQGIREADTVPIELPWLERKKRGRLRTFFQTCGWAFIRPGDLGRAIPQETGLASPLIYMTLVQTFIWSLQIAAFLFFPLLFAPGGPGIGMLIGYATSIIVFVAITVLICVPIWAGVAHMILAGSGPVRGGFRLTFASLAYSSGANLPTAIPFMGYLLGPPCWVISAVIATKEAQRVGAGRAALAVLPMPIIGVCTIIAAYVGMIGWIFLMIGTAAAFTVGTSGVQTTSVSSAPLVTHTLLTAALGAPDSVSPHPLKLLADGDLYPDNLIAPASYTDSDTWTISGVALSDLIFLTPEQLRQLENRLAVLPPQGQAGEFRLADTVFLTSNVNVQTADPSLWLFIVWPDPRANPVEDAAWSIWTGNADGSTSVYTPVTLPPAMVEQNARRAKSGLPPIKHPREIR